MSKVKDVTLNLNVCLSRRMVTQVYISRRYKVQCQRKSGFTTSEERNDGYNKYMFWFTSAIAEVSEVPRA